MKNIVLFAAAVTALVSGSVSFAEEEVNLYSARKEALIKPLLDRFTEATNIKVNLVTSGGDALLTRLKAEGKNSPADMLITVDAGRLYRAKAAGVLQAYQSDLTDSAVPAAYRDPEHKWVGISLRSRAVVYAPDRVKEGELSTYADLADPKWKGRICIRSSGNIYNQSLVAGLIANFGEEATLNWAKGIVANMARPPKGGDRDQIKAVAAGVCDIAVVNSYYFGGMLNSGNEAERAVAQQVKLFWPDQQAQGAHVNVSGVAITQSAKNKANATKLIEFLVSAESQAWYADKNNEFPVIEGGAVSETLKSWGAFKADPLNVNRLGELNADAVKLMDRAGWK